MIFLLSACGGDPTSATTQNGNNPTPQINSNQMGGAIQSNLSSPLQSVTTFAGVVPGFADGTGAAARFTSPHGVAMDGSSVFVADCGNHTVRKIVVATGEVTTLAGAARITGSADGVGSDARFNSPEGMTIVGTDLFVTDRENHTIRKIDITTRKVTTFAGAAGFYGSADGTGAAALFKRPSGITTDGTNLYVADQGNHTIRRVVITTGEVTTLAGTAGVSGSADGTGPTARFNFPIGVATDGASIYVADGMNRTIRKVVIASGTVVTIAGTAGAGSFSPTDGIGTVAQFGWPAGITMSGTNLFVTHGLFERVRKIDTTTGAVTTLAGHTGGSADGIGIRARFNGPWGITTDGSNLYVADAFNDTIRKVGISDKSVTTLAGHSPSGSDDGTGLSAQFNYPQDVTTDGTSLYIADSYNNAIRKVSIATGVVITLAQFNNPSKLTTDGVNLFLVDALNFTIRKIVIATGEVTTLAGAAGLSGATDGTGTTARFSSLDGITTDGINLYVVDSGNHIIRKIVISTGEVTTLAGTAGLSGSADGTGAAARFTDPKGITTDGRNLYIADRLTLTIRKIAISTGEVTTLAGMSGVSGTVDGTGTAARFYEPYGITTDGTNIYISDRGCNTIRKIVIATGDVTTLAGVAWTTGFVDGSGTSAFFYSPSGMTTDGTSLFITDSGNHSIRRIQ